MKLTRRHFLGGIGMAGAAGLAALRPADHGAAHTAYFLQLQTLLQQQGSGTPTLLLDLDLLDANIHVLKQVLKPQAAYRLVVKSLSSAALIDYVLRTDAREVSLDIVDGEGSTVRRLAVPAGTRAGPAPPSWCGCHTSHL